MTLDLNDSRSRQELGHMLTVMAQNFQCELDKGWVGGAIKLLSRYELDDIRRGLNHIMRTRVYMSMPTIAEIINAIEGSPEQKADMLAGQAWQRVMKLIWDGHAPRFDSTTALALEQAGGWQLLKETKTGELAFRAKEFKAAYRGILLSSATPEARELLALPIQRIAENGLVQLPGAYQIRNHSALTARSEADPYVGSQNKKIAPPGANGELKGDG